MVRADRRAGFTLVEILIVVVLLTILALALIPQFTDSTQDAKDSMMGHNLNGLREQIALYQVQHQGLKPTANIVAQLTSLTNADGTTGGTPTLGPYLLSVPPNPQLSDPAVQKLISIVTTDPSANITTHGWIYNTTNGKFFAGSDITH